MNIIEPPTIPRQLWSYFWKYALASLPLIMVAIIDEPFRSIDRTFLILCGTAVLAGTVGIIAGGGNILADRYRRNK